MRLRVLAGIVALTALTIALPTSIRPTLQFTLASLSAAPIAPPEVVIDASTPLGITISSVAVDSTHFGLPMLLIGTDTNAAGQSFVIRANPKDLSVTDTLLQLESKVRVVTAGYITEDFLPDYLVGFDSSVVLLIGGATGPTDTFHVVATYAIRPYDSLSDSATTPGTISDLEIDDSTGAFWVAYNTDVSFRPWPMDEVRQTVGGLRYFESATDGGSDVVSSAAIPDIACGYDEATGQQVMLVFWYSIYEEEVAHVGGEPRSRAFGYSDVDDLSAAVSLASIFRREGAVQLSVKTPDCIADFMGDGSLGFVYSYIVSSWGPGNPGTYEAETVSWSMSSETQSWTLNSYGTPVVWDLDGDKRPDVLLFGQGATLGIRGNTGEELFSVESGTIPFPAATGTMLQEGIQHGVSYRQDTLIVFHLKPQTAILPEGYTLINAPNPFNPSTEILYSLESSSDVQITVYDVLGRQVILLRRAFQSAGRHSVTWNGINDRGQPVGSGVYFCQIVAGGEETTRKMMLLK